MGRAMKPLNVRMGTFTETERVYHSLWVNWVDPCLTSGMLLSNMVEYWTKSQLSPATMKKCLNAYKHYYQYPIDNDAYRRAVRKINGLAPPPTIKAWTKDEAEKLIQITKQWDPSLYNMLMVTLHTGMRKGELFGLIWDDIDWLKGKINISKSWDGPTKSRNCRRVPMSQTVEEVLTKCYAVGATGHVFTHCEPNGRLKTMCKMAGVSEFTWHAARHTFATLALDAGRSPREVADMLGHAKVSTTLDLYWSKLGGDMNLDFLPEGDKSEEG